MVQGMPKHAKVRQSLCPRIGDRPLGSGGRERGWAQVSPSSAGSVGTITAVVTSAALVLRKTDEGEEPSSQPSSAHGIGAQADLFGIQLVVVAC